MHFNLLRDIFKQIRQFYYFTFEPTCQTCYNYVCNHIHYRSPSDCSYVDFTSIFLEKILKARHILKEFPNAIFHTKKKKNQLKNYKMDPRKILLKMIIYILIPSSKFMLPWQSM